MHENSENPKAKDSSALSREIGAKAARKLKAQRKPRPVVWSGLGMMGLIGWSVAIPTLLRVLPLACGWTNSPRDSDPGH